MSFEKGLTGTFGVISAVLISILTVYFLSILISMSITLFQILWNILIKYPLILFSVSITLTVTFVFIAGILFSK